MAEQGAAKPKKKNKLVEKAKKALQGLLDDLHEPDKAFARISRKTSRILMAGGQKFMRDEAMLRATSIGYQIVISFVPTLVVMLMLGSKFIDIEAYFVVAKEFVRKNGIPLELDGYFQIVRDLLSNAGAIAGIGSIVMLFSATSVLRNMEVGLNTVWRVKKGRPFIQKISSFVLVILFGPAFLSFGISTAQGFVNQFASPDLLVAKVYEDRKIVLGDKKIFIERNKKKQWKYSSILGKIEFKTQKDVTLVTTDNRVITGKQREALGPKTNRATKGEISSSAFVDMARRKHKLWIVTDGGAVIQSKDGGEFWEVQKIEKFGLERVTGLSFTGIRMFSDDRGLIIGRGGTMLTTSDGGDSWEPAFDAAIDQDLNRIARVSSTRYLIVASGFNLFVSDDAGRSWKLNSDVERLAPQKAKHNLGGVFSRGNRVWVVGQAGTLLTSTDSGTNWRKENIGLKTHDFNDVFFLNEKSGVMVANEGLIRYTEDAGDTWRAGKSPTDVDLVDITYDKFEEKIYVIGSAYHIIANKKKSISEFETIRSSPVWRRLVSGFGNFLMPFLVIFLMFFFLYKALPFTDVMGKAAATGAALTSVLLVIFMLLFKVYLGVTKTTFAVYGTLAAIPLGLLGMYVSILIMFFGAEVAFFVQYPGLIRLSKKKLDAEFEKRQVWYGLQILNLIYSNYEKGKGQTGEKALIRVCSNDQDEFERIMETIEAKGYVSRTENRKGWLPLMSPRLIKLGDLVGELDPADYQIPNYSDKNAFMKDMKRYFNNIEKGRANTFGNTTLADLL